jgi:hypothetical protein
MGGTRQGINDSRGLGHGGSYPPPQEDWAVRLRAMRPLHGAGVESPCRAGTSSEEIEGPSFESGRTHSVLRSRAAASIAK